MRAVTLRSRVHLLLDGSQGVVARALRLSLALLIVANVLAVLIETVRPIAEQHAGALSTFEAVSLTVFSAEYLLRLW